MSAHGKKYRAAAAKVAPLKSNVQSIIKEKQ